MIKHYNPRLKERAKELRNNTTFSERVLWKHLKSRQLMGYQFTRQKPIDNYIVDFFCSKLNLVIEVDGDSHNDKQHYDKQKNDVLRKTGLELIRLDGYFVINQTMEALEIISEKIKQLEKRTTP